MSAIDLTRHITTTTGLKLSVIDALHNAAGCLHDTDSQCAYVLHAGSLLDAVLIEIDNQESGQ